MRVSTEHRTEVVEQVLSTTLFSQHSLIMAQGSCVKPLPSERKIWKSKGKHTYCH